MARGDLLPFIQKVELIATLSIVGILLVSCTLENTTFENTSSGSITQPFRIGAILPLTKNTVSVGEEVKRGIDLAVEEVNKKGGINGSPLVAVYEDDQCDAKVAVTAAQKLIHVDEVPVIIGPTCSSNVLAVAPLAEKKKVVVITTVASTPKITSAGDFIFRNTPSGDEYSKAIADFSFWNLSARTAGILYVNLDNGIDYKDSFINEFTTLGGTILTSESYEKDDRDFRTQLLKIKEANPNILFHAGQIGVGEFLKQAKEIGIKGSIIGPVTMEQKDLFKSAGDSAEGVVYSAPAFDPQDKRIASFEQRFKEKYETTASVREATAYDAVHILAPLLSSCGKDTTCIKDGLYKVHAYPGVSGITSFDQYGDVVKPIMMKTIKNQRFVPCC